MNQMIRSHSNSEEGRHLLSYAVCFAEDFSVDWIFTLTALRPSKVLKHLEAFCQKGVLKKKDVDRFCFVDGEKKRAIADSIPVLRRVSLYRRIADQLWREHDDDPATKIAIAEQQMRFLNKLDECRRLKQIGDFCREHGPTGAAKRYYDKVIHDLGKIDSLEGDTLFVETALSYTKDPPITYNFNRLLFLLDRALELVEKRDFQHFEAVVLIHLAGYKWFKGQYDASKTCFDRGIDLVSKIEAPEWKQSANIFTMLNFYLGGRFQDIIGLYEKSEPIFAGEFPQHRIPLLAGIFLGLAYCYQGQVSQGRGLLDALRTHSKATTTDDTYALVSSFLGLTFVLTHDFNRAINDLTQTLTDTAEGNGFVRYQIWLYLAYCHFRKGQIECSVKSLKKSIALSHKNQYTLYFNSFMLELVHAMDKGDYPRVSGCTLEGQILQARKTHSIFMLGVAKRFMADRKRDEAGKEQEVGQLLEQSLELLNASGHQKEIALSQLALGVYHWQNDQELEATKYVSAASRILCPLDPDLIPSELKHMVDFVEVKDNRFVEILDLGKQIMSGRNSLEVVQMIFSTVCRITGSERSAIFLIAKDPHEEEMELWAAKNLIPKDTGSAEFIASREAIEKTMRTGEIQVYTTESIEDTGFTVNRTIKSFLCLPLVSKSKVIGCLYHDNCVTGGTFQEQDQKVLSYLSSFAAIALDNARAYENIQHLNRKLAEEKQYYEVQHLESLHLGDFIVVSDAMKNVLSLIEKVAPTESTVFIMGETGVGKGVVAREIHRKSSRNEKPFISLNCGALADNLIASELFGHEKGAFTGAIDRHLGRFELADGGTLFLDEIGEISLDLQVRLLRVLETREFERVGGNQTIHSDFRLLAATNRSMEDAVREGRFRSDLYYRLNVFPIYMPPLREREDDILPLSGHFLKIYADKMGKEFKELKKGETKKLLSYHWPGNVRELENIIERGVILSSVDRFIVPELGVGLSNGPAEETGLSMSAYERQMILKALKRTNWKLHGPGGAAELLGIKRSTLYYRMKKLGINKNRLPPDFFQSD